MNREEQINKCGRCKFAHPVVTNPGTGKSITFFGCYHEPYKGKWIAEIDIDKCPKDGEHDD